MIHDNLPLTQFLSTLTIAANFLGLAAALCLGLYIATRTPQGRLSWLTSLMLWALSGYYLCYTLMIAKPGDGVLPWLRPT